MTIDSSSTPIPGAAPTPASPSGPTRGREPQFSLPTVPVLVGQTGATLVVAGTWILLGGAWPRWGEAQPRSLAIIGAVWAIQAAIWIAIGPWKTREGSTWMGWWTGGTVIRLMGTPVAVGLIYSPPLGSPQSQLLAAGTAYVAILFVEVGIVARRLSSQFARRERTDA